VKTSNINHRYAFRRHFTALKHSSGSYRQSPNPLTSNMPPKPELSLEECPLILKASNEFATFLASVRGRNTRDLPLFNPGLKLAPGGSSTSEDGRTVQISNSTLVNGCFLARKVSSDVTDPPSICFQVVLPHDPEISRLDVWVYLKDTSTAYTVRSAVQKGLERLVKDWKEGYSTTSVDQYDL